MCVCSAAILYRIEKLLFLPIEMAGDISSTVMAVSRRIKPGALRSLYYSLGGHHIYHGGWLSEKGIFFHDSNSIS